MDRTDVRKLAAEASFTPFHGLILFWCAIVIVFDGYDLAVVGVALPAIMADLKVDPTQAGFMVSSALFGMMFGNVVFGALADRVGRRLTIVTSVAIFSCFTAAAGFAQDAVTFSAARFVAGLGIGGVMPNVIAQMTEYSPLRMRAILVSLMFSGYSVGGMVAAVTGKSMIEAYGWQSVFIVAALPMLLIPLLWIQMPESMLFLFKQQRIGELRRIAARLLPDRVFLDDEVLFFPANEQASSSSFRALFEQGRGFSTVMLWITCFLCLFMVYALSSWLTKLMSDAGYSLGSALTFVLVLNFGAMLGAIGGGWLADRFRIDYVLGGMYLLAAVSILVLGCGLPTQVLFIVVGLAGAATIGTQIVTCAYASQFYPTHARSTGLGLMLGVGRMGAIAAPILIGVLVSMELSLFQNFTAIAVPAVVAAISVLLVDNRKSDMAS